jgi:hypothetical protein
MINSLSQKMMQGALALAAALTLSIAAYAQNGIEQKVSFYLDGKFGTETIKKGDYKLIIPEAETGQVEIKVGKKIVAAQFTKRQNANAAEADKMTYRDNGDGTRTIATITPRGQKFTLVLEERGSVAKQ